MKENTLIHRIEILTFIVPIYVTIMDECKFLTDGIPMAMLWVNILWGVNHRMYFYVHMLTLWTVVDFTSVVM